MGSGADGMDEKLIRCPSCKRVWNQYSGQAASIFQLGHCTVCAVRTEKGEEEEKPMFREPITEHGESEDVIAKCGHHYRAAFEHGWKHAKEEQ